VTFQDIPAGAAVFVDANTFIYYFSPDPKLGPPCEQFLERIENRELEGYTSAHVVSEVAHRLMTLEACAVFGWPYPGIAARLRNHPSEVQQLVRYRQAIDEITLFNVQVLSVTGPQVSQAANISRQTGLLSSDALIVAVMREANLTCLASQDADFDRVPALTRYAPA
jgi:predicted nucleic acid-binding protein